MKDHDSGYSSSQPSRVEPPQDTQARLSTTIQMIHLALLVQAVDCLATINVLLGRRGNHMNETNQTPPGGFRQNSEKIQLDLNIPCGRRSLNFSGLPGRWSSSSSKVKSARGVRAVSVCPEGG